MSKKKKKLYLIVNPVFVAKLEVVPKDNQPENINKNKLKKAFRWNAYRLHEMQDNVYSDDQQTEEDWGVGKDLKS